MTRHEQLIFISDLTENLRKDIQRKINSGAIPENWDGFELRQLLADKAAESTVNMTRTRKRNYHNTVIVNNL